jgi:hypothetical protein
MLLPRREKKAMHTKEQWVQQVLVIKLHQERFLVTQLELDMI